MVEWLKTRRDEEAPVTKDCATTTDRVATEPGLALEAGFDGGRLTCDGGLPGLEGADRALGLCAAVAAVIREWRTRPIQHRPATLVRQRVVPIAGGYADPNDAATWRQDPRLKLVCGRLPETDPDLASQPT